ncbi:MAG: pyridoxal phosphate-dependent decarboxylase family protein [Agriterribacter sp.]
MLTSTCTPDAIEAAISTLHSDKDIFCRENADLYLEVIKQSSQFVYNFLLNTQKPFSGIAPEALRLSFDNIDFNKPFENFSQLLREVEDLYCRHAIGFHLPQYMAHLNCPVVIPAIAAEVFISAINSSLDTWDQSAGGTLIEQSLIQWTCRELGFHKSADGIFTSGGTQSNLMGLLLARDHFVTAHLKHNIKKHGLPPQAACFRIFASEASHFSIQRNASILGLGEESVVKVRTINFRMDAFELEKSIKAGLKNGCIPIAVVATAGTTDFGTVDPLQCIANIAAKYGLWYHVDAAYGCGLMLSDKYRYLLSGIELADSVTVDYHKSFYQPVSSSAFLVRNKKYFNLITHHADYLNPREHDDEGLPNQVNKSIQTTRRFDALKLWFTLKSMGKERLGMYFEKIIETAAAGAEMINGDVDFELLNYSDISAIVFRLKPCFYSVPDLCAMNRFIKRQILHSGKAMVAGTVVEGNFYLKLTILNPLTSVRDIRYVLDHIKEHGMRYVDTLNSN